MRYADAIQRDAGKILEFLERDPDRLIPSCPGWTIRDIAAHIEEMARNRLDEQPPPGLAPAIAALSAVPDAGLRGLAHEAAIHLWDASNAFGQPIAIDGELACDGVDEFFDGALPGVLEHRGIPAGTGQTVHLHRTDGDGEWMIRLEDRPIVTHEHAKGDVAVRGSSSDLVLLLWGRVDPPEVFGDVNVLHHLRSISEH